MSDERWRRNLLNYYIGIQKKNISTSGWVGSYDPNNVGGRIAKPKWADLFAAN